MNKFKSIAASNMHHMINSVFVYERGFECRNCKKDTHISLRVSKAICPHCGARFRKK